MDSFRVFVCALTIYLLIEFCDSYTIPGPSNKGMSTEVKIDEHPWQAAIYINRIFVGGATIIRPKFLLTSALFFNDSVLNDRDFEQMFIVVGTAQLDDHQIERHAIRKIYIHPNRSVDYPLPNDIAIIRLQVAIAFDNTKQPIPLPDADVPGTAEVTTTGWGLVSWRTYSDDLKQQVLSLIDNVECDNIKDRFNQHLSKTELTAGQVCTVPVQNRWDCQGDIGGPLVYDGVLIGIKSWGNFCFQGHPTIHTRVYKYLSWIKEIINME